MSEHVIKAQVRRARVVIYAAIALCWSSTLATAQSVQVDDSTGCEWTVQSFDGKDLAAVKAIAEYIGNTMRGRERDIGGRMLKRLSSDGYNRMVAAPIGICDQHRDRKLHDTVLETYDTFSEMQKSMAIE